MPKAPPKTGFAKPARTSPTKKPTTKDPKASHLYTDDNPSTTIHGTGFKDAAAAHRTLDLIRNRSLIYQFQTVNTMYHRAAHHPSMKKAAAGAASTQDMRAAMSIFREWLDMTYPAQKASLRAEGFKPVLSKKVLGKYLPQIESCDGVDGVARRFAKVYVDLPSGKKLGNVLVDDRKPMEADWAAKRYAELCELVPEGKEAAGQWEEAELWVHDQSGKRILTAQHLDMIAWGWSPVGEKKLG